MHSKVLSHAAQEWSAWIEVMILLVWIHTMCLLVTLTMCIQYACWLPVSLKSLQCACLLPKCLLKAYTVPACYQKLHKWKVTWMLVTCLAPNIPMLVNKVSS